MQLLIQVILVFFLLASGLTAAAPIASITGNDGSVVTIHDDACTLKDIVVNLPARITWEEKGKILEGCFSIRYPEFGYLVIVYFADKTVFTIPLSLFKRVEAA